MILLLIMRIKSLNSSVMNVSLMMSVRWQWNVNQIVKEHNNICLTVIQQKEFWKYYFLFVNYALIPINLLSIEQLLFEKLGISSLITYGILIACFITCHIFLNLMTASINKQSLMSYKCLNQYYIEYNQYISLKSKLKASDYYILLTKNHILLMWN